MKQVVIQIDKQFMETCGSNTLTGTLIHKFGPATVAEMEELILQFPQTPMSWRRVNGGADHWIMPEYSVMCLVDDIIHLKERGIKVVVQEVEGDGE